MVFPSFFFLYYTSAIFFSPPLGGGAKKIAYSTGKITNTCFLCTALQQALHTFSCISFHKSRQMAAAGGVCGVALRHLK